MEFSEAAREAVTALFFIAYSVTIAVVLMVAAKKWINRKGKDEDNDGKE